MESQRSGRQRLRDFDHRSGQPRFEFGQAVAALTIEFLARFSKEADERRCKDQLHAVVLMIDGGNQLDEAELQVRPAFVLGGDGRQGFESPHEIIAKVADGSSEEWRKAFGPRQIRCAKHGGESRERITVVNGRAISSAQLVRSLAPYIMQVRIAPDV